MKRMVASQGRSAPLWTKEKDLVGITRAGMVWSSEVQSDMRLRSHQLNAQEQDEDEE